MEQSLEQNTINDFGQPIVKRQRMTPPLNERVMLYVRQSNEDVYTPLHVVPPTAIGLLNAVSTPAESSRASARYFVVSFFFFDHLLCVCIQMCSILCLLNI